MSMTPARFRQLLLLFLALTVASIIAVRWPISYSQELADAYAVESDRWMTRNFWLVLCLAMPVAIAGISGFIGLFQFKAWGRSLSLYSTFGGLLLLPLIGPTLSSSWEGIFAELSSILWGAALALAYFSPVANEFGAKHSVEPSLQQEST